MKRTHLSLLSTLLLGSAALLMLGSCKGRTMDNAEPTGDTVEVVVQTPSQEGTGVIATSDNDPDVVPASTDE